MTPSNSAADNSDPRDYVLDLSTNRPTDSQTNLVEASGGKSSKAAFLSIHYKCCNVYSPIYKNAGGTAYAGHCPRCRRPASIAISPDGSTSRIFVAG